VPPESAFHAGEVALTDADALAALDALLPPARASLPALEASTVRCVKWGVRALPPRTQLGALPLLGRVMAARTPEQPVSSPTWVLVGLGARGLVYHALLAEQLATAVLTGEDGALPRECAPSAT
jgi:glycine/D-amino acid oxidase-like deaminating enzyme